MVDLLVGMGIEGGGKSSTEDLIMVKLLIR